MNKLTFSYRTGERAGGNRTSALVGVVASGNLEVLLERSLGAEDCVIEVATPVNGFDDVWATVLADFVDRASPGGLRISINDGGARPDAVTLRLLQGMRMMEGDNG
ncbi:Malonate decarboxylase subunit delta [Hartmannibacter diazotrophicus]|uniref:Malonate decarboxylase acyl carrier protein n=1 Tax=Hartmannibacter diazotrophicus TaxID=1482074 RepID=A0A2C9D1C6_9HYPH|nr:malonate decarboxylase acyl carrier protein [Hartmannibacter diazotrophicus]SON54033.1 Malonate decarboxylase subunit delta [Hartmannibacter diazotrophicus]